MISLKEDAAEEFVEIMGLVMQGDGLPRTAGRILAMLVLSDEPAGLDDIAEYLQVSRSGVSTNTRELERMGLIKRTTRAGDRQYYFKIVDDALSPLLNGHVDRLNKARQAIHNASNAIPGKWTKTRDRLDRMAFFYSIAIDKTRDIIDELAEADAAQGRLRSALVKPAAKS